MKQDLRALEEILDFLIKSKKKKGEEELSEEGTDTEEECNEEGMEELSEDILEEEEEKEKEVRPLPGMNRKPKTSFSLTELSLKSLPKKSGKKKGNK